MKKIIMKNYISQDKSLKMSVVLKFSNETTFIIIRKSN